MGRTMRLDKYLTEMGAGTRSQVKEMVKKGRITVDGQVEKRADRKIIPGTTQIRMDGVIVTYAEFEYYMLNKPKGVVSATIDCRYSTAVDLIRDKKRGDLFPVGRLDLDTEGLLLITNDGDLAHRLLSPQKHVDKVYEARVEGRLPQDAKEQMRAGLTLEDKTRTLPADLVILSTEQGADQEEISWIRLTLHEGKFHQVKRMFECLGCHVVYLKRLSMGPLFLDGQLEPGQYRPLTGQEVESLRHLKS